MRFVYLDFGGKRRYRQELRYSASTLIAEIPEASGNIIVYTDAPEVYANERHVRAIDISGALPAMTNRGEYVFRAKPCVMLDALRTFSEPCVFLDTDTFAKPGFGRAINAKLARGAVMDRRLERNPFPECIGAEVALPSGKTWRYDDQAVMYNSGVIGARPEHAAAIEDAICIIDAIRPASRRTHVQEQFAVNAALQLHEIEISTTRRTLHHYCQHGQKWYMRWRLDYMGWDETTPITPLRPCISTNKPIGIAFKWVTRRLPYLRTQLAPA